MLLYIHIKQQLPFNVLDYSIKLPKNRRNATVGFYVSEIISETFDTFIVFCRRRGYNLIGTIYFYVYRGLL